LARKKCQKKLNILNTQLLSPIHRHSIFTKALVFTNMESSNGLALLAPIPIVRHATVAESDIERKPLDIGEGILAQSDVEQLMAHNMSTPWPALYEDCPRYRERKHSIQHHLRIYNVSQ
jgi:hypothetical protein